MRKDDPGESLMEHHQNQLILVTKVVLYEDSLLGIPLDRLFSFWFLKTKNSYPEFHILEYKFQLQSCGLTTRIHEAKNVLLALWK